jgi:hypothetical protein
VPTKDSSIKLYTSYDQTQFLDGLWSFNHFPTRTTVTRTRTGDAVPSYRTKIRNGVDATSTLTGTYDSLLRNTAGENKVEFTRIPVPTSDNPNISFIQGKGIFNSPTWIATGSIGGAKSSNQALTQINKAIQDQYQAWNGKVFVAEVLQTARMLISPAKALRTELSKYITRMGKKKKLFRKGDSKSLKNAIASEWLELQFGLQPLINDSKAIAEALGRFDSPDDFRKARLRGSGYAEQLDQSGTFQSGRYGYIVTMVNYRSILSTRTIYRCGMSYALSGPFGVAKDLGRICGFTTNDWIPTLWEIIPFSFVTDYFVNVGQILDASFVDKSLVTWSNRTIINEAVRDLGEVIDFPKTYALIDQTQGPGKYKSCSGGFGAYKSRRRAITRNAVTIGVPTLTMRVPGVDSLKWLNLAALLTQASDFRNIPFRRG